MKNVLFLFAAALLILPGCDYVSAPQQAGSSGGGGGGNGITRRVLLEDFTGHTCPNCPSAAVTLHTLQDLYPDQIMAISIHTGWFGDPCPPHPLPNGAQAGSFSEDLTCATSDDYDAVYSMSGSPPVGMVNRLGYPSNYIKQAGEWASIIDSLLQTTATADLEFDTVIYNASTHNLDVSMTGKFIDAQNGTFNLAVMLVEDSLSGWQIDGTTYLPSYVWMHVLRDCINTPGSITGEQVATGTITANSTFNWTLSSSYNVSTSFNPAHCHLIAYIYNTATKEALQAAEADLQ